MNTHPFGECEVVGCSEPARKTLTTCDKHSARVSGSAQRQAEKPCYCGSWTSANGEEIHQVGCPEEDAPAATTASASDVYEVTIPGDGVFGGIKLKVDTSLPPDTIEMIGANRVRLDLRTGQITEGCATAPSREAAGLDDDAIDAIIAANWKKEYKLQDYMRAIVRTALAQQSATPGDWTVDDSELARKIMVFMGRATTSSLEPSADPLRDRLAEKLALWRPATNQSAAQAQAGGSDAQRYKQQRDNLLAFIQNAEVSSGVCCCGDDMAKHGNPMACGHNPVDMWDHSVCCLVEQIATYDAAREAEMIARQ